MTFLRKQTNKILSRMIILTLITLVLVGGVSIPLRHAEASTAGTIASYMLLGPAAPLVTKYAGAAIAGYAGQVFKEIVTWLVVVVMWIWAKILAIAGLMFALAIKVSVIDLRELVNAMPGIKIGWGIIRDLCNIFFIFVLLYIAIGTILQLQEVNVKQMVPRVIIVAVLINFSFAFTGLVIDAGNQLGLFFYQGLPDNLSESVIYNLNIFGKDGRPGLVNLSGVDTNVLHGDGGIDWENTDTIQNSLVMNDWIVTFDGLGAIVIFAVAAFVLGAGAILFIIRSVVLIFLLMISPLGFFFKILPGLGGISGQFWDKLIKQSFLAPAFLVLFYIVFRIMESGNAFFNLQNVKTSGAGALDYIGTLMFFSMMVGLLIGCLLIAQNMGAYGASQMLKIGKDWQGKATSWLGRNTVGMAAYKIANNGAVRAIARYAPGGGMLIKNLDKVANSSFAYGGGGKGYKDAREAKIKEGVETAKRLATDQRTGKTDAVALGRYAARQERFNKWVRPPLLGRETGRATAGKIKEASEAEYRKGGFRYNSAEKEWVAEDANLAKARKDAYQNLLDEAHTQSAILANIAAGRTWNAGLATPVPGWAAGYAATNQARWSGNRNEFVEEFDKVSGREKNLQAKLVKEEEKDKK